LAPDTIYTHITIHKRLCFSFFKRASYTHAQHIRRYTHPAPSIVMHLRAFVPYSRADALFQAHWAAGHFESKRVYMHKNTCCALVFCTRIGTKRLYTAMHMHKAWLTGTECSHCLVLNVRPQVHQSIFPHTPAIDDERLQQAILMTSFTRKQLTTPKSSPVNLLCGHSMAHPLDMDPTHESSHIHSVAGSFRVFLTLHILHKGTPLDTHFAPHHAYSVTLLWIHSL